MQQPRVDVTALLEAHRDGDRSAFEQLLDVVYSELHDIAHLQRRRRANHGDLQTTALVSELYLKLVRRDDAQQGGWNSRGHFFAACATAIRNILIDDARSRLRKKRGGGEIALDYQELQIPGQEDPAFLLRLDDLMRSLAEHDERLVRVFECRYFGGYSTNETASALDLHPRMVQRDWLRARAWLQQELAPSESHPEQSPEEMA